jgi:hypothetical protein
MNLSGQPPSFGRPSNRAVAAEARRQREIIGSYMAQHGLNQAQLAHLTGQSRPSVSRALHAEPPTNTPSLRKLYGFVLAAGDTDLQAALAAIEQVANTPTCYDSAAAAQILRAAADLLDRKSVNKLGDRPEPT